MESILSIKGLSKRFGRIRAVDDLSIEVGKGSVYGILGPNGSGKTTTLGIILSVLKPNSGTYQWFGNTPTTVALKKIGAILETPNFYPYLSAVKNLQIVADIKQCGYETIDDTLKLVNLYSRKDDRYRGYSLGMKQRVAIAAALLCKPEILLLDEPTNGLDPQGIMEIRELIIRVAKQGITIIIASHLLEEVEKICTDVAVIKSGKLLFRGKVEDIHAQSNTIEVTATDMVKLQDAIAGYKGISKVEKAGNKLVLTTTASVDCAELNSFLFNKGIIVSHLVAKEKSLEDHFMEVISK